MEQEKKKRKLFEKIIMGAVIGGAIGSVVGATLNKKNKEEPLIEEIPEKKRGKVAEFFKRILKKRSRTERLKEIPNEMIEEGEKDYDKN